MAYLATSPGLADAFEEGGRCAASSHLLARCAHNLGACLRAQWPPCWPTAAWRLSQGPTWPPRPAWRTPLRVGAAALPPTLCWHSQRTPLRLVHIPLSLSLRPSLGPALSVPFTRAGAALPPTLCWHGQRTCLGPAWPTSFVILSQGNATCSRACHARRNVQKHARELEKVWSPGRAEAIVLVEACLAVMRLSSEKFFVLAAVLAAHLLWRHDAPSVARLAMRANHLISSVFQKVRHPGTSSLLGSCAVAYEHVASLLWQRVAPCTMQRVSSSAPPGCLPCPDPSCMSLVLQPRCADSLASPALHAWLGTVMSASSLKQRCLWQRRCLCCMAACACRYQRRWLQPPRTLPKLWQLAQRTQHACRPPCAIALSRLLNASCPALHASQATAHAACISSMHAGHPIHLPCAVLAVLAPASPCPCMSERSFERHKPSSTRLSVRSVRAGHPVHLSRAVLAVRRRLLLLPLCQLRVLAGARATLRGERAQERHHRAAPGAQGTPLACLILETSVQCMRRVTSAARRAGAGTPPSCSPMASGRAIAFRAVSGVCFPAEGRAKRLCETAVTVQPQNLKALCCFERCLQGAV